MVGFEPVLPASEPCCPIDTAMRISDICRVLVEKCMTRLRFEPVATARELFFFTILPTYIILLSV